MKITIKKGLLFLQAVLLFAGFPVIAMENDSNFNVETAKKSEKNKRNRSKSLNLEIKKPVDSVHKSKSDKMQYDDNTSLYGSTNADRDADVMFKQNNMQYLKDFKEKYQLHIEQPGRPPKRSVVQNPTSNQKSTNSRGYFETPKQIANIVIGGASAAASYVAQSPIVKNPLVNTVVSFGNMLINTTGSLVSSTEDYVRQSVDLVGFNVEQGVFKKFEQAFNAFTALPENNFGLQVFSTKDILSIYTSRDQKVRAIGTVLEQMKPEGSIDANNVQEYIKNEQAVYAPIKEALEEMLSQSYAEIRHKYTLVDALNQLSSKTEQTVKGQLGAFKNAVDHYFNNLKNEKQKIEPKNEAEKVKIDRQIEQYRAITDILYKAADLYQIVFLIDNAFTNLLRIEKKYIDIAIDIYTDYVDWLTKYKTRIKTLNQADFNRFKEHVNKNKQVDFIIKLNKKHKKSTKSIFELCKKQGKLLEKYLAGYNIVSTIVGYAECSSPITFKNLAKHLDEFIESDEFSLFTQSQQQYIQSIVSTLKAECNILDKVVNFTKHFSSLNVVQDVITKHDDLTKKFETYQEQELKDHFADISVNELTVNRSEGIKKLVEKHRSVSAFIKLAEDEQAAYAKRQEKRFFILEKKVEKTINDLINNLLNNDKQPTDQDLNQFDSLPQDIVEASDLKDQAMVYTTEHKKQLITIVTNAVQDAKNSIKVAIVAGWTVIGVEAKLAFEELANTNGSDAKSIVKRGFGKALNAVRKGLIGTGNKIAKKEYHKETRKEIKNGIAKAYKTAKSAVKNLAAEAQTSWDNSAADCKDTLKAVKALFSDVCAYIQLKCSTKWQAREDDRNELIQYLKGYKKQIAAVWDEGQDGREAVRLAMKGSMLQMVCKTMVALDDAIEAIKNAKLADLQATVKKAFEDVKESFLKWKNGPEEIEMKNIASRDYDDDSSEDEYFSDEEQSYVSLSKKEDAAMADRFVSQNKQ